jgi:hypothetical protein
MGECVILQPRQEKAQSLFGDSSEKGKRGPIGQAPTCSSRTVPAPAIVEQNIEMLRFIKARTVGSERGHAP